jgi:NitT/TauT family transport system permease protein
MSVQQSGLVLPQGKLPRPGVLSEKILINLLRFALLVALLGFWQFASGPLIAPFFVSSPSAIVTRLSTWIMNGQLFFHMGITAAEAALGFMFGSIFGIAAGVVLGRREFLAKLLDPFIMTLYSLPKVALAPLFILWIGIGMDMKVIFTAMIVFFLVFLNTYTGVRNVSRELISILHLMGANERQVLQRVVLPSAITWVFAGLKISVPYALIGAIVGELMASNKGLGALLVRAQGEFDTAGVFAALVAIMFLAVVSNGLVKFAERKLMPWKEVESQREGAV